MCIQMKYVREKIYLHIRPPQHISSLSVAESMHTYFLNTLNKLDVWLSTFKQEKTVPCKSLGLTVAVAVAAAVTVAASVASVDALFPKVTCIQLHLNSCELEGEGCRTFLPDKLNSFCISMKAVCSNVDDWSVCILQGIGEIVSIDVFKQGVEVTYRVNPTRLVPDKIYVSIQFRGVYLFPTPVEICQASFRNYGRLVHCTSLEEINTNLYYIEDVLPGGSLFSFRNSMKRDTAIIYEIIGDNEPAAVISRITASSVGNNSLRLTSTRSAIGVTDDIDTLQLVEVSFADVIIRTFPFTSVFSFDICEASDCMVISFYNSTDIVVAKLSTGNILRTIHSDLEKAFVVISPSGQFVCVSNFITTSARVYSSITGELSSVVLLENNCYVYQFVSDTEILVCYYRITSIAIVGISTGNISRLLPDASFLSLWRPVIRGQYVYCFLNKKLCTFA
jgi:hypothetical protein